MLKRLFKAFNKPDIAEIAAVRSDEILRAGNKYISELEEMLGRINTGKLLGLILNTQVKDIVMTGRQIMEHAEKNPASAAELRTFVDYYFPMTIKLVKAYTDSCGQTRDSAADIIDRIRGVMDTIVDAFHKQLDAMYEAKKLDIKTDIAVLQQVIKSEGLK